MDHTDTRAGRVLIRVRGRRNVYPQLMVFVDGLLVFEQQTSKFTVADEVAALVAQADEVATADDVSRIIAAAVS